MTIKTFSAALLLAFAFTACQSDAPQQSATPTEATPAATPDASTQTMTTPEVAPSMSANPGTISASPQMAAPAPAPAGGSGKVNPPHGQPGHVCGTPVGSPLDGSAGATAKQAQPAAKQVTVPAPTGAQATVAPGTNPPHGQPGHVCGSPVGSPLPKQ